MKKNLIIWIEEYLFFPNAFQKLISYLLLPFTFIYLLIIFYKRATARVIDFNIPIISIGNIIVGGSGKTPLTIALAKKHEDVFVILRGYGRESKGLQIVSQKGKIEVDVETSGDEAMLLAQSLPNASIIVCEDRVKAIIKAKQMGAKIIFLDDGFSKYNIKKFNILIRPANEPENIFCLPSGGYREPKSMYAFADLVIKEGVDFRRVVSFSKDDETVNVLPIKLLLITAISKPKRVLEFLPKDTKFEFFPDHHNFTKDEIEDILSRYKDYSFITTQKDLVKLSKFNIANLYLMNLELQIDKEIDIKI